MKKVWAFLSGLTAVEVSKIQAIFDQRIFDLRDCSNFLGRELTVPDYCGVYALKKNLPIKPNQGSAQGQTELLRRRNREMPGFHPREICDSQPCQREPLHVKVKVSFYDFLFNLQKSSLTV